MHLHAHRAKVGSARCAHAAASARCGAGELSRRSGRSVAVGRGSARGWLQADGFVGQYDDGTNRSLTIEFQVANDDEYAWVLDNLRRRAARHVHRQVRESEHEDDAESPAHPALRRGRCVDVRRALGPASSAAPRSACRRGSGRRRMTRSVAYLRSIFQATATYLSRITVRERVRRLRVSASAGRRRQLLLNAIGIYSRRTSQASSSATTVTISRESQSAIGSRASAIRELIGFVGARQAGEALESLSLRGLQDAAPNLREEEIVAIERARRPRCLRHPDRVGEYLSTTRSHCFILSVDDTMESILDWNTKEGKIFRGGSGSGINLSNIRGSMEPLSQGRHRLRARSRSCAAPTRGPARSSRAARRAARPRWSCSTSTTRTSASSSGARPRRRTRPPRCATPGSTCRSTATASSRSSTRTRTTRSGSPTSSCTRSRTTSTGA